MSLLIAESERLWSRRITRFFPALLALLMVVGIIIAYFVIENDADTTPDFLIDMAGGIEATTLLGPVTSLLPIMAYVIAASFIGADVKTGMVEQILTWEPRRIRFILARMAASGLAVSILAMVLAVLLIALLYGLAAVTGTTGGLTAEFWGNVGVTVLRTGLATALFGIFGLGVTVLVNNSVGSIVGFVIYWFIIENFLVAAFLPRVAVYLPIANASSFASGADVQRIEGSVFGEFELIDEHSYLTAGLILAAWTCLAAAAGVIAFRRRDIS